MIAAAYKVAARAGMLVVGTWASTSIEMHIAMRVHSCIGGSTGDDAAGSTAAWPCLASANEKTAILCCT